MFKSIKKRFIWLKNVRFDKRTGFFKYKQFGKDIYIRYPRHYSREQDITWLCENIFFHYYLPKDNEQVIDLGAGYGDEAAYLSQISPNVKYLAVEAQPVIYECISNTFRNFNTESKVSPFVISDNPDIKFISQYSYASVGSIPEGYIEIPTIKWNDFLTRYGIKNIDLLKMNIEGGEKPLLESIDDFSIIKRLVISCHDFRANNNEGEFFRTKDAVISILEKNGYTIKTFNYGINWSDDWIFASREN